MRNNNQADAVTRTPILATGYWLLATLLLATGYAAAADEPPVPPILDLQMDLSRQVLQLARSTNPQDSRGIAQDPATIESLARAFFDPLLAGLDDKDPEVVARCRDVLRHCGQDALIHSVMAQLGPASREKLRYLIENNPELVRLALSTNLDDRRASISKAMRLKGSATSGPARASTAQAPYVEPLLLIDLLSGQEELVDLAIDTIIDRRLQGSELHLVLLAMMVNSSSPKPAAQPNGGEQVFAVYSGYPTGSLSGPGGIMMAATSMKSRSSAPVLLALMERLQARDARTSWASGGQLLTLYGSMLADSGELGAIPALMKLMNAAGSDNWSRGLKISARPGDASFLALLRLTKQNPSSYGLVETPLDNGGIVGFADAAARAAAIEKFSQWWQAHQDSPEYRDLPTLSQVDLDAWAKQPLSLLDSPHAASSQGDTPAASQQAAMDDPGAPAADIRPALSAKVRQLTEFFRSPRLSRRQAAQTALLTLHGTFLRCLGDADRQGSALLVGESLANAALAELPVDQRGKMLAFRKSNGDLFHDLYSPDTARAIAAIKKLRTLGDSQAQAEPALIRCLQLSSRAMLLAALETAGNGSYHSDAIADALMGIVLRERQNDPSRGFRRYPSQPGQSLKGQAMKALAAVKNPQCAPMLIAMLGDESVYYQDLSLVELIGSIGGKAAIPPLYAKLAQSRGRNSSASFNGKAYYWSDTDGYLLALVKLTGQNPDDYKFVINKAAQAGQGIQFGFANNKAHDAAIKKFKEWWESNKDQYKTSEPMTIPALPAIKDNPYGQ